MDILCVSLNILFPLCKFESRFFSQKTRYTLFESDTNSQDILVGEMKSHVTHFAAVTTLNVI